MSQTVLLADVLHRTKNIKWVEHANEEYIYIDLSSVDRLSHSIIQTKTVNSQNAPSRAQRLVQTGDVIFGITRPTLNRLCIIDEKFDGQICSTGFCILRADKTKIIPEYIYHLLTTQPFMEQMERLQRGTSYPAVTDDDLKSFEFRLPPLEEQKRIVKKLDEAFGAIDEARANTEKNLKNSQELFESVLTNTFVAHNWTSHSLESLVRFIDYRGRTPAKTKYGMRLVTAKNIKLGYLQEEPREFVNPEIYDSWMTRGIPIKGDVLFTSEAPLANVAQLDTDEKVVFAQRCIILQPDRSKLDPTFLKYMLLADPVHGEILSQGTGATVKGIKARLLKKVLVFCPPVKDQLEIVKRLNELSTQSQKLQKLYRRKLDDLEELRQSILKQAFAGKL